MDNLSDAERMALAVLRGDLDTARALADHIINDLQGTVKVIVVERNKINLQSGRVRCLIFVKDDAAMDEDERANLIRAVSRFMTGETNILGLTGIDRVEFYELPEG